MNKKDCYWPHHEPRIHAQVTDIQPPDRLTKEVTIVLSINNRKEIHGEVVWVVPFEESRFYRIGDVYAAHFKLMSEMPNG